MPRNNNMTGSKWFTCGLCQFEYPVKYKVRQRGIDVCTFLPCKDKPGGQSQLNDPRAVRLTEPPEEVRQ